MPHRSTVLRWIKDDKDRQSQYQVARDCQFDWLAEEIIKIADDSEGDYYIEDRNGKSIVVPDHARVHRSRLKVEARKWILSKLAPRKFGDKAELLIASDESGSDGKGLKVSWEALTTCHVIVYPLLKSDGRLLKPGTPEHDEAIEKAAQEARADKQTTIGIKLDQEEISRPLQIEYKPEPLPSDLTEAEWSLMHEVLSLVKATIPSDQHGAPEPILRILREALLLHFRETEIESAAMAS